jgi:hypothetical protein
MTNWLNPMLDRVRFWAALEWLISWFGVYPKRMTAARRYV